MAKILIADDSATIQKVIKIAFARLPFEMIEAISFPQAANIISQTPNPALLILDANLPGLHGPEGIQKLLGSKKIPVLLLVGSYDTINEDEYRQAGYGHFLRKPFESLDIVTLVEKLLEESGHRSTGTKVTPPDEPVLSKPPGPPQRAPQALVQSPLQPPPQSPPQIPSQIPQSVGVTAAVAAPPPGAVGGLPPPPQKNFLHSADENSLEAPPPKLPPTPGAPDASSFRGLDTQMPPFPPAAQPKAAFTGDFSYDEPKDAFDGRKAVNTATTLRPSTPPGETAAPDELAELMELIRAELPSLVALAVREYCEKNFVAIAREVVTSELRKLAEEKSRHLVDN